MTILSVGWVADDRPLRLPMPVVEGAPNVGVTALTPDGERADGGQVADKMGELRSGHASRLDSLMSMRGPASIRRTNIASASDSFGPSMGIRLVREASIILTRKPTLAEPFGRPG